MPRLEIRHLLMLAAIDACISMTDAARRLSITASALSHRIREAERRIGVPLVTHAARKPQLTDAGVRLLNAASGLLRTLEQAEQEVAAAPTACIEVVRLAASTLSRYEWLSDLMWSLRAQHPSIDLEIALDVAVDPIGALRERIIDIAVVPSQVGTTTLASLPLYNDEMVVLLPEDHPKAKRHWLDVSDLLDEIYVTDGTTRELGREYERVFAPAGVQPRRVVRAGSIGTVLSLVSTGFGVTIGTRAGARTHLQGNGLIAVPLTERGTFVTWHAVMRRPDLRRSAARVVADQLAGRTATHPIGDMPAAVSP